MSKLDVADLPLVAPRRIRSPVMVQRWSTLAFIHWPYEPSTVQHLLPDGLEVDTFDGAAWVGLIPFHLSIRFPPAPWIPWAASCDEINLRTYVRGPDGGRGIWFLSLDASRLLAVAMARGWYYLPYMWAEMRIRRDPTQVRYTGRRRWPSPQRPRFDITVEPGSPAPRLEGLERFLVCRWRLYSPAPSGVVATDVEHPPWPLRRARAVTSADELFRAARLHPPSTAALAHFSPGVVTRFGPRTPL
jgi:uncharacterized protein